MNRAAAFTALVPPGVVMVTLTGPAVPAGDTAVAAVLLEAENDVAATLPNFTPVAPVRLVPTIDTWVPPFAGPWFGLIAVMVGGARR